MAGYRYLLLRHKLLLATAAALLTAQSTYIRVLFRAAVEGPVFSWAYVSGVDRQGDAVTAGGHGLTGHVEYLLIHALGLLWLLWAGLRRADGLFRLALFGWMTLALGMELWFASTFGVEMTVTKRTIGLIGVPAVYINLPPIALTWLLSLALLVQNRPDAALPVASWTPLNSILIGAGAVGLVAAGVALNTGEQHGSGDLTGVILIYVALTALFLGASPWARRSST